MMFSRMLRVPLVCITACLTSALGNNLNEVSKAINDTDTVSCTGCENHENCIITINNVTMDQDSYTIFNDGTLLLPANDLNVYGTVQCGGSIEQIQGHKICPPKNGQYDWLSMTSDVTTVLVGDTFTLIGNFSQLPHSGISLFIDDDFISADGDLRCTPNDGIHYKIVEYTCTALNPSTKSLKMQLSFCDIEFCSIPIVINILAPSSSKSVSTNEVMSSSLSQSVSTNEAITHSLSQSPVSTNEAKTSSMTSSNQMMSSTGVTSSTSISTTTATTNIISPSSMTISDGGNGLSGGAIAGIIIAVFLILLVVIIMIILGIIYYRRSRTPHKKNHAHDTNGNVQQVNVHLPHSVDSDNDGVDNAINPEVTANDGDVSATNGHALSEVATVPFEECASRGYNQQKAELVLTARTTFGDSQQMNN